MEWVEVRGSTVDVAVEAALSELGLASRDEAEIEVIEEPAKGFLGMGSRDALVRVTRKPRQEKRQRRRKRDGNRDRKTQPQSSGGGGARQGRSRSKDSEKTSRQRTQRRPADSKSGGGSSTPAKKQGAAMDDAATPEVSTSAEVEIDAEGQAGVVADFLNGLLDSFGLEGDVTTRVEDDLIVADVMGEQTEALIGPKGSIMQSVGELTRTVVQRKTHRRARLRLDVGGYLQRRREALRIYAGRLAEQVIEDGGEIMLEPMNPADRKTVHDAIVEIEGVRSFSEGEEPNRSVVIALAPGVEPRGAESVDASDEDEEDVDASTDDAGEDDSDE